MLKGTSGPKEDVRGLKKDCECLSWIGGHILKVLTLSLHHVCPPFPGLCYFQSEDNELESGKGFFSAGLQWEMIRDYYRMKINDKVWAVYEEEKQEVQQEQEEHVPNSKAKGKSFFSPILFTGHRWFTKINDLSY